VLILDNICVQVFTHDSATTTAKMATEMEIAATMVRGEAPGEVSKLSVICNITILMCLDIS